MNKLTAVQFERPADPNCSRRTPNFLEKNEHTDFHRPSELITGKLEKEEESFMSYKWNSSWFTQFL